MFRPAPRTHGLSLAALTLLGVTMVAGGSAFVAPRFQGVQLERFGGRAAVAHAETLSTAEGSLALLGLTVFAASVAGRSSLRLRRSAKASGRVSLVVRRAEDEGEAAPADEEAPAAEEEVDEEAAAAEQAAKEEAERKAAEEKALKEEQEKEAAAQAIRDEQAKAGAVRKAALEAAAYEKWLAEVKAKDAARTEKLRKEREETKVQTEKLRKQLEDSWCEGYDGPDEEAIAKREAERAEKARLEAELAAKNEALLEEAKKEAEAQKADA